MKKLIILVSLILMTDVLWAGDPNSMEIPTEGNPITVCAEADKNVITIKLFGTDDMLEIVGRADFLAAAIRDWWKPLRRVSIMSRMEKLTELHKDESLASLDAQIEAKKVK